MNQEKFILNLQLELLFLAIVLTGYLILRYVVMRRPITYKEFENWFLKSAAVLIICFITYFLFLH
jgi:hypothetical protein